MKQNSQLVKAIREKSSCSKAEAEAKAEVVLTSLQELAKENGKITIIGFGTFSYKTRAARVGRNPQTGNPVNIPAKEVFAFKASK